MHLLRKGITALAAGIVLVATASAASAGTITTPSSNPFVVPGDASGNPQPFTITASGFAPGALVFVEQCDGVATTAPGWSPTANCDLGSSPSPKQADGSGNVTFLGSDQNFGFTPFKGAGPQDIFNCLSPHEASPNNGSPDFTNCKVRVSTNNNSITSDQTFFDITLPDTPTVSTGPTIVGGCTGSVSLGKITPGLTDKNGPVVIASSSLKSVFGATKGQPLTGGCNLSGSNVAASKVSAKLSSPSASCASSSTPGEDTSPTAYPLNGKLTVKEAGPGTQIATYVSVLGFNPHASDVVDIAGIVTKGDLVGARVGGSLWEDPATKDVVGDNATGAYPGEDGTNAKPKVAPTFDGYQNSGYSLAVQGLLTLAGCQDGVPDSVLSPGLQSVLIGDGASLLKQFAATPQAAAFLPPAQQAALSGEASATGVTFSFGE